MKNTHTNNGDELNVKHKTSKNKGNVEWAYTDNVRQIFRKQQGTIITNGQMLHRREQQFGFTIDKLFIVSLCTEYRKCHAEGNWKRL